MERSGNSKTIGGYILTCNGASGLLRTSLDSLCEVCDVVYVLDNDSSDGTSAWLQEQLRRRSDGLKKVLFDDRSYTENAGKMRQKVYEEMVDEHDPDMIIALDDDEQIVQPQKSRKVLEKAVESDADELAPDYITLWNEDQYRTDGTWYNTVPRVILRNRAGPNKGKWSGGGGHTARIPMGGNSAYISVPIIHYGWRYKDPEKRVEKMESKKERDKEKAPQVFEMDVQQQHYNSIYEEPELEKLPDEIVEQLSDRFKDDQSHEVY